MSLQMRTIRTGFPKVPQPGFSNTAPGFDLVTTGEKPSQEYLSGARVAIAYGQLILNDIVIKPPAQSYPQTYDDWFGTLHGSSLEGGAQYFDLIHVASLDEGIPQYRALPTPFWPERLNGVVFHGYTVNAAAVTGFVVNAAACLVTNALGIARLPSGALDQDTSGVLTTATENVFASAELVEFEDGLENAFTTQLIKLIKDSGSAAVLKVETMIFQPGVRAEITAQTLLCLGRIDDDASASARSQLVRHGLKSSSGKVRDAAAVAISSMADAAAISDLATAVEHETIPSLKQDMREILKQLQT